MKIVPKLKLEGKYFYVNTQKLKKWAKLAFAMNFFFSYLFLMKASIAESFVGLLKIK